MTVTKLLPLRAVPPGHSSQESRVGRDRLELLTALIGGPRFDPMLRPDVIVVPRDHAVFGWGCRVTGCRRHRSDNRDLCSSHVDALKKVTDAGGSRAEFLRAARPLEVSTFAEESPCRICLRRPSNNTRLRLCHRHNQGWLSAQRDDPEVGFEAWLAVQHVLPGFGDCAVPVCDELAVSARGLCTGHHNRYRLWSGDGRPGATPRMDVNDATVLEAWCRTAHPIPRPGRLTLSGVAPLVAAEIKWGMFMHGQQPHYSNWPVRWLQGLANRCREERVTSLMGLEPKNCPPYDRMIVTETRSQLRLVYYSPADTKDAGFIEFDHFGGRLRSRRSFYDLSMVSQRWLRDLLWDNLAEQLRAPNPPRSDTPYDASRRAIAELSAYLDVEAPAGGHDPTLLNAEHMHAFVADQRHRARNGLKSLGCCGRDGTPTVMSETTRSINANHVRRVLRQALDRGETDRIGLAREFVVAAPTGGVQTNRTRRPFPDDVAQALADEANLAVLADEHDPHNGGIRLIWEAIIYTGRRCGEIIGLKLNCVERYSGLPVLWHDQTKVGNYDEAIRIPEILYTKILDRRQLTIQRFEYRHGRAPTEDERVRMALFPSLVRNPDCIRPASYAWFHTHFRAWVDGLDLGRWVAHQARHTLATKLLANGAALHHIRRYLGHVSPKMTEHYAKIAVSALDDVLNRVWVAGPGAPEPGRMLSGDLTGLTCEQAEALAIDLSRRSTPTEGGFCTFQPVVAGGSCPFNLNCETCDKFVMSGADLLYWRRKREQWTALAERAPDDATADYLHQVFAPTARAIDGLEKALAALGLLDDALALDLRRPQDYFHRVWNTAFRATHLTGVHDDHPELEQENL